MALADAELNDADRDTLTVLSDGRATLGFVQTPLEEHGRYLSRQYISQRIIRFAEHGHLNNVRDSGVTELVDDLRHED